MDQLSSMLEEIEALKISSAASPAPLQSDYSRPSLSQDIDPSLKREFQDLVHPSPIRPPQPERSVPLISNASNVFTEFHTLGQSSSQNNPPINTSSYQEISTKEVRTHDDPRTKFLTPSLTEETKEEAIETSVRTGSFSQTPNLTEFSGGQVYEGENTKEKIKRFSHFLLQQTQSPDQHTGTNNKHPPPPPHSQSNPNSFQFTMPSYSQKGAPLIRHDLRKKKAAPQNNTAPLSARRKKKAAPQDNQELLFKPRLNPISVQLDKQHEHGGKKKRWERLHALKGQRELAHQSKISKHLEEKLEEEIAECSFKPQIESHHIHDYIQGSVVDRTLFWQQERNNKLERTKQELIEQQLQHCSFKPQISEDLRKEAAETGKGVIPKKQEEGWYEINGVQKHLERQFVGRQTREEKEQFLSLRYSPLNSRWKNESTRPQEFKFLLDERKDPFFSSSMEVSRHLQGEGDSPEEERKLGFPIGTFGRTSGNLDPLGGQEAERRGKRDRGDEEEEELRIGDPALEFDDALNILHNSLHDMKV